MSDLPLVTIGLPFYNDERTIVDAVKSVLIQTYVNWELIMVNDGSTDGSFNLLKELHHHPKIVWINDGTNKGLIARLNQISSIAKGRYVARMDADDLMDPERIEKQVRFLMEHPDVDLVDTGTYSIDRDGVPCGKRGLADINYDPKHIIKHAMLLHASIVGKKEWFLKNPYDKEYVRAEDYELWCRTYRSSTFARIKEPLYIVREGRVSVKNYKKSMVTVRKIMRKYGKGVFKSSELYMELFKSKLKVFAYEVFSALNKHDYLSNLRNERLSEAEKKATEQIINNIKGISI